MEYQFDCFSAVRYHLSLYVHRYRRALHAYDAITFKIKYPDAVAPRPKFNLGTWNHASNVVSLDQYSTPSAEAPGWIDVFIPFADLRTAEWDLGNVESMVFTGMSAGCDPSSVGSYWQCERMLIDDIVVLDLTPPHIAEWSVKSATVIKLTLNEPYNPLTITDKAMYGLTSSDDASYSPLACAGGACATSLLARSRQPVDVGQVSVFLLSRASQAVALHQCIKFCCDLTCVVLDRSTSSWRSARALKPL